MNQALPDVAKSTLTDGTSLDWVGMERITMPVLLNETECHPHSVASVDVGVNLLQGEEAPKGIHMSRLYRLVNQLNQHPLTPAHVFTCLTEAVSSQETDYTTSAELTLRFDLLLQKDSLISQQKVGWHRYPITITTSFDATLGLSSTLSVGVSYSSTCPCSAALTRAALTEAFTHQFSSSQSVSVDEVAAWLNARGTDATPHSQRSLATISIQLDPRIEAENFGLATLIHRAEEALQTPVQAMVKRADEQAFARRNGENLMYVEDATRRLADALVPYYQQVKINVEHFESLHAHNAVARTRVAAP